MAIKSSVVCVVISFFCGPFIHYCKAEPLTLEEYDALTTPSVPTLYSFCASHHKQYLSYAGTCHSNAPDHPQYPLIKKEWEAFKEKTGLKNTVVIVETLPDAIFHQYQTKQEAINLVSDRGYALWLAQKHNLTIVGAELSYKTVFKQLLREFKKEHVHYFCFAFASDFWTRYDEKPNLEAFILERVHLWTGDNSITFEYLCGLHHAYTGKVLATLDKFFFLRLMTLTNHTNYIERILSYFSIPYKARSIIYPLLRRSHQLRDAHTFTIIRSHWEAGKNIFIVYGALHAAALKEPLRRLTQQ